MPTRPVVLVHSVDPDTGLTRCGHEWAGDTHQARYVPRLQCPGCRMVIEEACRRD